jgi:hypothetical protein
MTVELTERKAFYFDFLFQKANPFQLQSELVYSQEGVAIMVLNVKPADRESPQRLELQMTDYDLGTPLVAKKLRELIPNIGLDRWVEEQQKLDEKK